MINKKIKVYIVGSNGGYSSFIKNKIIVSDMKVADVVLFTGGSDISPTIYGEKANVKTHPYPSRDNMEIKAYQEAVLLDKVIWGTCRGIQLIGALNGAKLIQDMDHPHEHRIHFHDNIYSCMSNSLHHQMVYPYNLPKEDYYVLAWARSISDYYSNVNHNDMEIRERDFRGYKKEPEFLYFPKTKSIGLQGHPEMMNNNSAMVTIANAYLNLLIEDRLDDVLKMDIPVNNIIENYLTESEIIIEQVVENKKYNNA